MISAVFRYAIRNLFRRKSRSLFATTGIAVGISAVIALVAISSGLLDAIQTVLNEFPGDLMVSMRGASGLEHSLVQESLAGEIAGVDGVAWVEPFIFRFQNFAVPTIIGTSLGGGHTILPLYGVKPGGHMHAKFTIAEGRDIAPEATDEVLLGAEFAKQWRTITGREALPTVIPVNSTTTWRVVGVFRTDSIQDTALVVSYGTAQQLVQMDGKATAILIGAKKQAAGLTTLATGNGHRAVRTHIEQRLPETMQINKPTEFLKQFESDLRRLQSLVFAIGFIAALAGAIGVLNTMMSNVHERTRELGLLLAVGWRPREVMAAVMAEGFSLSFVGGLAAIPIAYGLIRLAEMMIRFNPIPGGIDPAIFALGIGLSVALGLVGSVLPGWRASQLNPVDSLREL